MTEPPLLEVRDLKKYYDQAQSILPFSGERPPVRAVDGVSITLPPNTVIGIIGESGCGKTTLIETVLGLHEPTEGEIRFKGKRFRDFEKADWKEFRRRVQIVLQDPFNSLDPKMTIRESLLEPVKIHGLDDPDGRIYRALEQAGLEPDRYLDQFPRELSGGEKQRVSIARALVLEPDVLLADEPVSMLDVSTQAALLKLFSRLSEEEDLSILYISHDLSTVSYICDVVNVMYLGEVVEAAETEHILKAPMHPYTQSLIQSIPIPDPYHDRARTYIDGPPPSLEALGGGCRFKDRCPERMPICDVPPIFAEVDDRNVSCHLHYDHEAVANGPDPAAPPTGGEDA